MEQLKLLVMLLPWVVAIIAIGMALKMEDKYSKSLLAIMSSLIFFGLQILISGYFIFGTILLVLGMIMVSGMKTPKSPPKTIYLITFFGKPTESISEGLTITLTGEWFDVVGTIEIPVELKEETVTVPEEIRCNNSVPVGGTVSIGFIVDIKDDGSDKANPKTRGQKVNAFVRNGQVKGVMETIKGSVIQAVKEIAKGKDPVYMETQSKQIGEKIREDLERGVPRGNSTTPTAPEDLITLSDFGVDVSKIAVSLTAPEKVRKARADIAVEEAQRASQLADTATMDKRVRQRIASMYGLTLDSDGNYTAPQPSTLGGEPYNVVFMGVRATIVEEQTVNDGRYQVVRNPGGVNVVDAQNQQGGRRGVT